MLSNSAFCSSARFPSMHALHHLTSPLETCRYGSPAAASATVITTVPVQQVCGWAWWGAPGYYAICTLPFAQRM